MGSAVSGGDRRRGRDLAINWAICLPRAAVAEAEARAHEKQAELEGVHPGDALYIKSMLPSHVSGCFWLVSALTLSSLSLSLLSRSPSSLPTRHCLGCSLARPHSGMPGAGARSRSAAELLAGAPVAPEAAVREAWAEAEEMEARLGPQNPGSFFFIKTMMGSMVSGGYWLVRPCCAPGTGGAGATGAMVSRTLSALPLCMSQHVTGWHASGVPAS